MNWKHWAGIVLLLLIGFYVGKNKPDLLATIPGLSQL